MCTRRIREWWILRARHKIILRFFSLARAFVRPFPSLRLTNFLFFFSSLSIFSCCFSIAVVLASTLSLKEQMGRNDWTDSKAEEIRFFLSFASFLLKYTQQPIHNLSSADVGCCCCCFGRHTHTRPLRKWEWERDSELNFWSYGPDQPKSSRKQNRTQNLVAMTICDRECNVDDSTATTITLIIRFGRYT